MMTNCPASGSLHHVGMAPRFQAKLKRDITLMLLYESNVSLVGLGVCVVSTRRFSENMSGLPTPTLEFGPRRRKQHEALINNAS